VKKPFRRSEKIQEEKEEKTSSSQEIKTV